ncbi:hypothetical protein FJZ27_04990 [Candidatus Peribacteria bacterium]|nr:hypothetical protein [Candidatus Peribacteria bacterium]
MFKNVAEHSTEIAKKHGTTSAAARVFQWLNAQRPAYAQALTVPAVAPPPAAEKPVEKKEEAKPADTQKKAA